MKKLGIIFDFDGTLTDSFTQRVQSHRKVARLITEFLKERGIKASYNDILEKVIKTEEDGEKTLQRNRDDWWKKVFESLGVTKVPEEFISKLTDVLGDTPRHIHNLRGRTRTPE